MISQWTNHCVNVGDLLLGWSLSLPRDLTLIALALLMTALLLVVRCLWPGFARLQLIADDERRLRQLRRQAREAQDRDALARHRRIHGRVALQRLKCELPRAVASMLPLLLIITWGSRRLEFLPVHPGETTALKVTLPASVVEDLVHLVPIDGVASDDGWVRQVTLLETDQGHRGQASWTLRIQEPATPTSLVIRVRDETLVHPVTVGLPTYEPCCREHGIDRSTCVELREYRPFGFIPAIRWLGLPAWLTGLMVLTIVLFLGTKFWRNLP